MSGDAQRNRAKVRCHRGSRTAVTGEVTQSAGVNAEARFARPVPNGRLTGVEPAEGAIIMARRHDALITLTHDHHHALVQASALIAASDAEEPARIEPARAFLDFYRRDTLLHFHEEEEVLFPRLLESVDSIPQALISVLVDHVRIHGMVTRLKMAVEEGNVGADQLRELGEQLRAHIRREERELFPLIERSVPEEALRDISFAKRKRSQ
jgi:hemerythrin-like domain-containing protein